jgi:hypothetical protein
MKNGLNAEELKSKGLDIQDIATHQARIQSVEGGQSQTIPILDTCRLENAGILPQEFLHVSNQRPLDAVIAFVPAAGAASRYFKPLQELRQALAQGDEAALQKEIQKLRGAGAESWPLPPHLSKLLSGTESPSKGDLLEEIDAAKALLPYAKDAGTFLDKKDQEHRQIKGIVAQVYVAPLGQSSHFKKSLHAKDGFPTIFLEQGPEMCTLRFLPDGTPYRDRNQLSLVSAGHGTLVKLFPEIKKRFPKGQSLFIRNIDNVLQDEAATRPSIELFLRQHQTVLDSIKIIRAQLREGAQARALETAQKLLDNFKHLAPFKPGPLQVSEAWKPLWSLLLQVFHCPAHFARLQQERYGDREALKRLLDRPLNSMGQVPNSGKDVGGTPVYARHDSGDVTICLELPHVSSADRVHFLENPARATHFNPVFVAAELPDEAHNYKLDDCPFWILAEKSLHGTAVVYHEIVLYELLGNSFTANVLFPEIPRSLFHPHKALTDGVKK